MYRLTPLRTSSILIYLKDEMGYKFSRYKTTAITVYGIKTTAITVYYNTTAITVYSHYGTDMYRLRLG